MAGPGHGSESLLTADARLCAAQGAAKSASPVARSGREKRARTDDDDPVEVEPLLDDVSDAGREEAGLCRFVISPNACRFAACH